MRFITRAIANDREFKQAMLTLAEQYTAHIPLPISAGGLSDGAMEAFLAEVRHGSLSHIAVTTSMFHSSCLGISSMESISAK